MESPSCEHSKLLQLWPFQPSSFYKAQAILQEILRCIHCRAQGGHHGFHRVTEIGGFFCQSTVGFGGERCLQLLQLFHNTSCPTESVCARYAKWTLHIWIMGCAFFPWNSLECEKWSTTSDDILGLGCEGNQLELWCSSETGKSGINKAGAEDAIGNMMPLRSATNDALSQEVSTAAEVPSEALPNFRFRSLATCQKTN